LRAFALGSDARFLARIEEVARSVVASAHASLRGVPAKFSE